MAAADSEAIKGAIAIANEAKIPVIALQMQLEVTKMVSMMV